MSMRQKCIAGIILLVFVSHAAGRARTATPSAKHLAQRARAALAQTSGVIKLDGLAQPVTVLRDPWGIPHIYAETVADLFFAQGFVAAQDRLWQMEIWRRTGEGRLAEILGPAALERDKFARLLRYRGDLQAEWSSYAPDARLIIESFVRGVNAFIKIARQRPPIEFQLTGIPPAPWTPEVCLTRMAGYVMTGNINSEVLRAQLIQRLGAEPTAKLLETDPPKALEVPTGLDLSDINDNILALAHAAQAPILFGTREGSNNWVVGGARTATGKPILANDPHRALLLPALRYLVHLVGPGWDVIGAGEPALPGVAIGHNKHIGFGFTICRIDQQDLYVEETDPQDPTRYRWQDRWEKMKIEKEFIRVKDQAQPVTVELHFTRHGPVIYEDRARHRAYALRWAGSEPGTAGYLAALALDRATNWSEFLAALERWKLPPENIVYADIAGNIGWQAAGLAPVRRGWSGLLPVPGRSGQYEWEGFLPLAELPRQYNPPNHFIATANHNVLPVNYKHEIGFEWTAPFRFHRIEEVLRRGERFTIADFERLQHDEVSLPARELVPLLKGVPVEDPALRAIVDRLLRWDGVLSKDSAAAAVYEVWTKRLTDNLSKAMVPADGTARQSSRFQLALATLIKLLKDAGRGTLGPHRPINRDQVLLDSLKEAVGELTTRFGADVEKWPWGKLHLAEFNHPLATEAATHAVLSLKAVARGGDGFTVNATGGSNFRQTSGASYRQILDLSDWDNSVATSVPGQSGQPGSEHYADLLPLWAEGRYFPLLFSRSRVEKNAKQRLILKPARK